MASLTARQERFCRRFVESANAAAAAREAGYAPRSARNTAHKLLRLSHVAERIALLQMHTARTQCRDREVLIAKLESVFRQAVEDNQFHAAARAIDLQAKLAGFATTRTSSRAPAAAGAKSPAAPSSGDPAVSAGQTSGSDQAAAGEPKREEATDHDDLSAED
jgi:phage terminase small subunit